MANINMDSILSKIHNSERVKNKIRVKTEQEACNKATEAGNKLANILIREMDSSIGGKIEYNVTSTSPINLGNNEFIVSVNIDGMLYRPSLSPRIYDGVDNIIALFNNGYAARNHTYGLWHEEYISSLTQRDGIHFVQSAAQNFMTNYGSEYGIIAIDIHPRYN